MVWLKAHYLRHHTDLPMPYRCDLCSYSTVYRHNLAQHSRKHHKGHTPPSRDETDVSQHQTTALHRRTVASRHKISSACGDRTNTVACTETTTLHCETAVPHRETVGSRTVSILEIVGSHAVSRRKTAASPTKISGSSPPKITQPRLHSLFECCTQSTSHEDVALFLQNSCSGSVQGLSSKSHVHTGTVINSVMGSRTPDIRIMISATRQSQSDCALLSKPNDSYKLVLSSTFSGIFSPLSVALNSTRCTELFFVHMGPFGSHLSARHDHASLSLPSRAKRNPVRRFSWILRYPPGKPTYSPARSWRIPTLIRSRRSAWHKMPWTIFAGFIFRVRPRHLGATPFAL